MGLFAIQIKTGTEDKVQDILKPVMRNQDAELFFPKRKLTIHKKGKKLLVHQPLYKGYMFIKADQLDLSFIREIKFRLKNVRFLPVYDSPRPLPASEEKIINKLTAGKEIIGFSDIDFDENNNIIVREGPLKDLEGLIVKVDKRKKRARVKLHMYEKAYLVDFGFNDLSKK